MERAIEETNRRRETQRRYNFEHGTSPQTVQKMIRETVRSHDAVNEVVSQYSDETRAKLGEDGSAIRVEEIPILISSLEKQMKELAKLMEFEKAASVRDEIESLRALMGTSSGRLGQDKRRNKRMSTSRR
jgi:excinuclease ABC subunit B